MALRWQISLHSAYNTYLWLKKTCVCCSYTRSQIKWLRILLAFQPLYFKNIWEYFLKFYYFDLQHQNCCQNTIFMQECGYLALLARIALFSTSHKPHREPHISLYSENLATTNAWSHITCFYKSLLKGMCVERYTWDNFWPEGQQWISVPFSFWKKWEISLTICISY